MRISLFHIKRCGMVPLSRTEEIMDKAELRPLIFEILRRESQTHLNAVAFQVRNLAENYERHDALKIHEIIWELLVQGVLAPGKNSLNITLPFFHVTEYGEECLESGEIILHDYDRYLHDLEASIDEPLDPIIRTYVHAAQKGFLSGNYLATMSLLADAGERCIDMVVGSVRSEGEEGCGNYRTGLKQIRRLLPSLQLPLQLRDEMGLHLEGLRNLIAHTRDGHDRPRAVSIAHRTAQGALLVFPQYVHTTYLLVSNIKDRSRA